MQIYRNYSNAQRFMKKKFTYTDFIHITWFCIETAESGHTGRSLLLEIKCQPKL